jgi:NADP-dependent 3-hydroxy-3-methylglutaryl-CoA reductase
MDRNVRIDAATDARMTMVLGGTPYQASIVEVSETSIVVTLDGANPPPLVRGLELPECVLDIAGVLHGKRVHGLRVEEVEKINGGGGAAGLRVRLADHGSSARASLWLVVEMLERGVAGPPAPAPTADSIPKIPARGVATEEARLARLAFARQISGAELPLMDRTSLRADRLTKNVEAFIGSIEIPVGLAGPLLFRGQYAEGLILAPLATTEGALVASVTRGATALTRAGGVTTRVLRQVMNRTPVFVFRDLAGAALFARWIEHHVPALREEVSKVSTHGHLTGIDAYTIGREVHVVFNYDTSDAAGQNMTSSMTWHACKWLIEETRNVAQLALERFQVEGNMSGDKKFAYRSFINGRGFRVAADCYLPHAIVREVLKVEPRILIEANESGIRGAMQSGMAGYTINASNAIAALFTATGQDIACVHESGTAIFSMQLLPDAVYASILLPSLVVGTVGGGTHLPHQREMLELMGCSGDTTSPRLAEIVAGFCLGLDLSTMAAVASDQFVHAHERLGRNRPIRPLETSELDREFFRRTAQRICDDPSAVAIEAVPIADFQGGSSMVSELTARRVAKPVGLLPFRLRCGSAERSTEHDVMVKVKPTSADVVLAARSIATLCGTRVSEAFTRHARYTGLDTCDVRELAICRQAAPKLTMHMPRIHDVVEDRSRETFILVTELLHNVVLRDSADDGAGWDREHIEAALRGVAAVHSVWLGREAELSVQPWIGTVPTAHGMTESAPLWAALTEHAAQEFPAWYSSLALERSREIIRRIPQWWGALERHPRTLIHNDFNPRNICLRPDGAGHRLCAYDWELATLHVPQHDLAELLVYVLTAEDVSRDSVDHYVEYHRRALEREAECRLPADAWREGFRLALWDLAIHRIPLSIMAHTIREYRFIERVHRTLQQLMTLEGGFEFESESVPVSIRRSAAPAQP